jgi:GR25 family glycosyltransferase involved in LPS biosynthesis
MVKIEKGYVINLKKRPDRLERFQNQIGSYLPDINIDVVEAIDGSLLDLTDSYYKKNVNKWNFDNLSDKTLRGVIGCCLSHLKCYDLISKSDDECSIIFEDDCAFRTEEKKKVAQDVINKLEIQERFGVKFGIIFLNKWDAKPVLRCGKLNRIEGSPTAEAYIISKEYAKILYKENINNIGAMDAHMGQLIQKYPEYPSYQLVDELFTQYDRKDTNIQFGGKLK